MSDFDEFYKQKTLEFSHLEKLCTLDANSMAEFLFDYLSWKKVWPVECTFIKCRRVYDCENPATRTFSYFDGENLVFDKNAKKLFAFVKDNFFQQMLKHAELHHPLFDSVAYSDTEEYFSLVLEKLCEFFYKEQEDEKKKYIEDLESELEYWRKSDSEIGKIKRSFRDIEKEMGYLKSLVLNQ